MEPLTEETHRWVLFPIQHPDIYKMAKDAEACIWHSEELDLEDDVEQFQRLSDDEKRYITCVLAFFAASDGIVLENLGVRFMKEIQIPEVRFLFCFSPLFPREKCVHPRANSYSYSLRVLHLANVILTENHSFHRRERSMDSKLPSRTFILVRLFDDRF